MQNIIKKAGFNYAFNSDACASCAGRCCTGESGYIYVSVAEIEKITAHLGMSINDFGVEYLFKNGYKYSLKERQNGSEFECVFYDRASNGCKIYEVRPSQCISFPFWDYFKDHIDELKAECPGIVDV